MVVLHAQLRQEPAAEGGEAGVTPFDVGQGLAVLVRTRTHTLLYDTGPAYGAESDSAGWATIGRRLA